MGGAGRTFRQLVFATTMPRSRLAAKKPAPACLPATTIGRTFTDYSLPPSRRVASASIELDIAFPFDPLLDSADTFCPSRYGTAQILPPEEVADACRPSDGFDR